MHPFLNPQGSSYVFHGISFHLEKKISCFINMKSTNQLHKSKMHVDILMPGEETCAFPHHSPWPNSHRASCKKEMQSSKILMIRGLKIDTR